MTEAIVSETVRIGNRECRIWRRGEPAYLLIQPAADREGDETDREAELIAEGTDVPFLLVVCPVNDWNRDLSPWPAPPVFGSEGFGGESGQTLAYLRQELIPDLRTSYGLAADIPVILGGYSLAGLFALWSVWQAPGFAAAAAASPSVWFPGWIAHAEASAPQARTVYLSLGDREEQTRNKVMATVGDSIRKMELLLRDVPDTECVLEWNEGNHFKDPGHRCARAFLWCVERMEEREGKTT